jgi:hypothetical protein
MLTIKPLNYEAQFYQSFLSVKISSAAVQPAFFVPHKACNDWVAMDIFQLLVKHVAIQYLQWLVMLLPKMSVIIVTIFFACPFHHP